MIALWEITLSDLWKMWEELVTGAKKLKHINARQLRISGEKNREEAKL